jgi:hypothetical protein
MTRDREQGEAKLASSCEVIINITEKKALRGRVFIL